MILESKKMRMKKATIRSKRNVWKIYWKKQEYENEQKEVHVCE